MPTEKHFHRVTFSSREHCLVLSLSATKLAELVLCNKNMLAVLSSATVHKFEKILQVFMKRITWYTTFSVQRNKVCFLLLASN